MATHSSVLAWRIPGTGDPGGLPSVGSHRVRTAEVTEQQQQQHGSHQMLAESGHQGRIHHVRTFYPGSQDRDYG